MTWQLTVAGLLVAAAVFYLARSAWKVWKGARTGCGGCGGKGEPCSTGDNATPLIPSEQLTLRRRDASGD